MQSDPLHCITPYPAVSVNVGRKVFCEGLFKYSSSGSISVCEGHSLSLGE
jgi:hypothetical protein